MPRLYPTYNPRDTEGPDFHQGKITLPEKDKLQMKNRNGWSSPKSKEFKIERHTLTKKWHLILCIFKDIRSKARNIAKHGMDGVYWSNNRPVHKAGQTEQYTQYRGCTIQYRVCTTWYIQSVLVLSCFVKESVPEILNRQKKLQSINFLLISSFPYLSPHYYASSLMLYKS